METVQIIVTILVFVVIAWWALTANFDACDECNHNCRQGRDCPRRNQDKKEKT